MSVSYKKPWLCLYRTEDYRFTARSVWNGLRCQVYVNRHRVYNRFQDARARLAGACNADTWIGLPPNGYAGGYSHWRCGKPWGHPGRHRFNNYTWSGLPAARTEYNPLPIHQSLPFAKLAGGRRCAEKRGRARKRERWNQERLEERLAAIARRNSDTGVT